MILEVSNVYRNKIKGTNQFLFYRAFAPIGATLSLVELTSSIA